MRLSRIFTDQPLAPTAIVVLGGQAAHYLSKVLRLKSGSAFILFNGDGFEYSARLLTLSKKQLQVEILEQLSSAAESPLRTILGLAISRGERMDYAVQKSTELGISEIVPIFTERGEVKLRGERMEKRQAHWQQVAVSACEQSGRVIVPTIHRPLPFRGWVNSITCTQKLIFDHRESQALPAKKPEGEIAILIGPEGGFSEPERETAKKAGFTGIKLGPRVLRTETAPVVVLSVLQYLWGDF